MASRFIHRLEDLDGSQVASAGGKGASLGELRRAGVRVPPAFVVNRSAFDAFMATADPHGRVAKWLADVDTDCLGCAEAAAAIQELLGNAPVPDEIAAALRESLAELGAERVSVRSSATCEDGTASAWAVQLQTFLNVAPDDVPAQVKARDSSSIPARRSRSGDRCRESGGRFPRSAKSACSSTRPCWSASSVTMADPWIRSGP